MRSILGFAALIAVYWLSGCGQSPPAVAKVTPQSVTIEKFTVRAKDCVEYARAAVKFIPTIQSKADFDAVINDVRPRFHHVSVEKIDGGKVDIIKTEIIQLSAALQAYATRGKHILELEESGKVDDHETDAWHEMAEEAEKHCAALDELLK